MAVIGVIECAEDVDLTARSVVVAAVAREVLASVLTMGGSSSSVSTAGATSTSVSAAGVILTSVSAAGGSSVSVLAVGGASILVLALGMSLVGIVEVLSKFNTSFVLMSGKVRVEERVVILDVRCRFVGALGDTESPDDDPSPL